MKFIRIATMLALTVAVFNAGAELDIEKNLSGFASLEQGQIVKGTYSGENLRSDHVWVQRMFAGFTGEFLYNPLPIKTRLSLEMRVSNEYPRKPDDQGKTRRLYFYPYMTEADFFYSYGNTENPVLSVTAGYFPIKYNKNARNLGEYLFRSGTYPQYLVSDFDFPAVRLVGLNVQANLIEGLTINAIANTNIEWQAIGDLNLSGLVSYSLADFLELGAGACFTSILSADTAFTTRRIAEVTEYVNENGDTAVLTFAGTKLMGRLSVDLKKIIHSDLFGREDLKIYSEAAILGVKNYPLCTDSLTHYDTLWQRIPVMFGINLPTFRILDVLSVEAEWFGSRFPNDMGGVVMSNSPTPFTPNDKSLYTDNKNTSMFKDDDWKWSVYAKRTFVGHFMVTTQVASDHLRWFCQDWYRGVFDEALKKPNQFYYICKLGYIF
jgi:hypothetical protein